MTSYLQNYKSYWTQILHQRYFYGHHSVGGGGGGVSELTDRWGCANLALEVVHKYLIFA